MKFPEWLENEIKKREWTPAKLARKARLYPATINRVLNGERQPGPDFCNAVARALDESPEYIFRLAGLLPDLPAPDNDPTLKEIYDISKRLTEPERRRLLNVAHLYLKEQQAEYYTGPNNNQKKEEPAPSDAAPRKS